MPTFDMSAMTTAYVGGAEVYKKNLLKWRLRELGVQVRPNVKTPQALAKFSTDGGPQPYRAQDDFNGVTVEDRTLTAYAAKYDQEIDGVELYNTYMAELPEAPFEQWAVEQGGAAFLDALMTSTIYSGVRNGAGTAAADICDGFGTIIAAEITATNLTPVVTGAVTAANAVTQVEIVNDARPIWMKEREDSIVIVSYDVFEKYRKHYRTLNGFGFKRDERGQYTLDGTTTIMKPASFMGSSQRIICTLAGNLVFGTDMESLKNYPTPHLNLLQNRILMTAGCQIKDLAALIVNDQA